MLHNVTYYGVICLKMTVVRAFTFNSVSFQLQKLREIENCEVFKVGSVMYLNIIGRVQIKMWGDSKIFQNDNFLLIQKNVFFQVVMASS
jgi:hypothetical protein